MQPNAKSLQAQLDLADQYQNSLLSTVHWALGISLSIVVATLVVVIGLGWYTNFKLYRKDIASLEQRLEKKIKLKLDEMASKSEREISSRVRSGIDNAMRDVRKMQLQMLQLEAQDWEKKGVIANAVYAIARAIPIAHSIHSDLYVPELLDEMLRLLKHQNMNLRSNVAEDVAAALDEVRSSFPTICDAISATVKKKLE